MQEQNVAPPQMPYFKEGEWVTIRAAANGFIIEAEEVQLIATNPQDLLATSMGILTNHADFARAKAEADKQQAESEKQLKAAVAAATADKGDSAEPPVLEEVPCGTEAEPAEVAA